MSIILIKLTDHLQLHFCEIPKLENLEKGHLKNWLKYFTIEGRDKENEMRILLQEEPVLHKAHQAYQTFTQDDTLKEIYKAQEKAQKDIATRLDDAKLEGMEKGMEKVAKKMKAQGFDVEMIQELTGLSPQEIAKL